MKNKKIILIAGYPGAGKIYLANFILNNLTNYCYISQDTIKEKIFDENGFDNIEEKEVLIIKSRDMYFNKILSNIKDRNNIITDYPFSNKQKNFFQDCCNKNNYEILTIRLIGDLKIIYQRRIKRDLRSTRHVGHLLEKYHKDDLINDKIRQNNIISFEDFKEKCISSGYKNFALGKVIEIDVTDFLKVDYNKILDVLK